MASPSNQKIILALISCAAFISTLDSTIVNISLPTIAGYFSVDLGQVSWVVMAYLLALAGLMLAFGRLGDLKGFRRIFLFGLLLFTISSLLCGLSTRIEHLIFFRVIQGAGASAIQALIPAMIAMYLPEEKRGWAFGILMTTVSLGIAGGPILGGYITEFMSWHWIFFLNVPIGIIGLLCSIRYLPVDTRVPQSGTVDTRGAVLILFALVTLLLPLNQGIYMGWNSPIVIGSACASVLFWSLFLFFERRDDDPIIDMQIFSSHPYLFGNIAGMCIILTFAGTEFLLPFYLEMIHGFSTEIAGLFLAIPAVIIIVAGPVAGSLSDRYGPHGLMVGAALVGSIAMILYSFFSPTTDMLIIAVTLAIEGFAVGFYMPPNMSLILSSCSREKGGVASSVMMTLRNVGGVLGIAIFGAIAMQNLVLTTEEKFLSASSELVMIGFRTAFLTGVVICILAAIISWYSVRNHL